MQNNVLMNKKFFGTKYFGLMKQKLNCLVATTKNIYLENKGKAFEERLSVIKHRGGPRLFQVTVCGTGNIVQMEEGMDQSNVSI